MIVPVSPFCHWQKQPVQLILHLNFIQCLLKEKKLNLVEKLSHLVFSITWCTRFTDIPPAGCKVLEEAKSCKRRAQESAGLGWHKIESPLILGLGFTVLLVFAGPLKLIFGTQQGWRPTPQQTSVSSVCWKVVGANVVPPACMQTGFLPNHCQIHPEKVSLQLGQGKALSKQLYVRASRRSSLLIQKTNPK